MAVAIKLSDELVNDAKLYAKAQHRTPPKQIEHWAQVGKMAEENPDLPFTFIQEVLLSHEEANQGQLEAYQFG